MPSNQEKESATKQAGIGPNIGQFLTLGLQLAIAVVVFFFLGRWLDEKFETTPVLTLIGAGLGIAGGMVKFFKTAMMIGKQADGEFERSHRKSTRED